MSRPYCIFEPGTFSWTCGCQGPRNWSEGTHSRRPFYRREDAERSALRHTKLHAGPLVLRNNVDLCLCFGPTEIARLRPTEDGRLVWVGPESKWWDWPVGIYPKGIPKGQENDRPGFVRASTGNAGGQADRKADNRVVT